MALQLDFNIVQSDDGSYYTIVDTTGAYDAGTNPGGWGSPNYEISDITNAEVNLEILDEDGNYTSVLDSNQKDVWNTLPSSSDGDVDKSIELEDGYYRATYSVWGEEPIYADKVKYFTFYAGARCCFKKYALAVSNCNCDCNSKKLKLMELHVALNAIETASEDTDAIEGRGLEVYKCIDYISKMCSTCGCGC